MFFNRESKYDSFVPNDIFKKDEDGNTIYFMWGKGRIVNDPVKQARLVDLEGYKYFILSYKAPIIIPIIMFAVLLSGVILFSTDFKSDMRGLVVYITIVFYLIVVGIYKLKIRNVIKDCKPILSEEKKRILQDV